MLTVSQQAWVWHCFLKTKYHGLPSVLTTSLLPFCRHCICHCTWLVFSNHRHQTEWKRKERVGWNKRDKESDSVLVTVGKYSMFEQRTFQPLLSQPYTHKHAHTDRTNCLLSSWTACHLPGDCWVELTVYQWWTYCSSMTHLNNTMQSRSERHQVTVMNKCECERKKRSRREKVFVVGLIKK